MQVCILMQTYAVVQSQENLLLDDDSNIKLIDFGLVAEPEVSAHFHL